MKNDLIVSTTYFKFSNFDSIPVFKKIETYVSKELAWLVFPDKSPYDFAGWSYKWVCKYMKILRCDFVYLALVVNRAEPAFMAELWVIISIFKKKMFQNSNFSVSFISLKVSNLIRFWIFEIFVIGFMWLKKTSFET